MDLARDQVLNYARCLCYALLRLSITAYGKAPHFPVSIYKSRRWCGGLWHTIGDRAIRYGWIFAVTGIVIRGIGQRLLLNRDELLQLAPSVRPLATGWEACAKRQRALVDDEMDVGGSRARCIGGKTRFCSVSGDGLWCIDDLDIQAAAERLDMRDDKLLVWWGPAGRQSRRELREAEGSKNTGNVGVVGEVKVEGLVEREGDGIVIESDIILSSGARYGVVR